MAERGKSPEEGPGSSHQRLLAMASILWIPTIFVCASYYLYYLSINMPSMNVTPVSSNMTDLNCTQFPESIRFPTNLQELTEVASVLQQYKGDNFAYVLLLFCSAYLYKQTFAIPGSVFLNMLAGSLVGVPLGFTITCFLSALGASCCYLLSRVFGRHYVQMYFPKKVKFFQEKVKANFDSLLFFLLFLRLFPMSPNWLLNVVSPLVDIPLHLFFISVLVGLMPYNFICVQAGSMLSSVNSLDDVISWSMAAKLLAIAIVALLPSLIIKRIKSSRLKIN